MKGLAGFGDCIRRIWEFNSWHPLFAASDKSDRHWRTSTHVWALVYALIVSLPVYTSALFGRHWWSYAVDVAFLACVWAIYEVIFYFSRRTRGTEKEEKAQIWTAAVAATVMLAVMVALIGFCLIVR